MLANPFTKILGYKRPSRTTRKFVSVENRLGCYINEAGLYELILRSTSPNAPDFYYWAFNVMLPRLRADSQKQIHLLQENVLLLTQLLEKERHINQSGPPLNIYEMPCDEEGQHCYIGICTTRPQPLGLKFVGSFKTQRPFNLIKDMIPCCVLHNKIYCNLDADELLHVMNKL